MNIEDFAAQVAALARQLEVLTLAASTGAPSVVSFSWATSILGPKPARRDIEALTKVKEVKGGGPAPKPPSGAKAPPQPSFEGTNYSKFLARYRRWSLLAGLEYENDEMKRTWFMASMGENILPIVEAIHDRTDTFLELVEGVSTVFPSFVNDFSLRHDVQNVKAATRTFPWSNWSCLSWRSRRYGL